MHNDGAAAEIGTTLAPGLHASGAPACFIVDDDAALRRIIGHSVKRAGMAITECGSLDDIARALGTTTPHLIFLDIGLHGAEATDVLEMLAQRRCEAFVQIVSGRSEEELADIEELGLDLGMRMLPPLRKPFRGAQIAEIVDRLGVRTKED